jgi:hypothetical protein
LCVTNDLCFDLCCGVSVLCCHFICRFGIVCSRPRWHMLCHALMTARCECGMWEQEGRSTPWHTMDRWVDWESVCCVWFGIVLFWGMACDGGEGRRMCEVCGTCVTCVLSFFLECSVGIFFAQRFFFFCLPNWLFSRNLLLHLFVCKKQNNSIHTWTFVLFLVISFLRFVDFVPPKKTIWSTLSSLFFVSFFCCETIIFLYLHNTLHFFLFAFFLFIFVFLMCCGGQVYRCKVSPNGRMIASCSPYGDKSVRVWGMEEGCELMRLKGDDNTWVSNTKNTKHKKNFCLFLWFDFFCQYRMYEF